MPTLNLAAGRIADIDEFWMARKSSANRGKRWPAPAFRLSDWFSDHRRAIAETFEFVSLRLGGSLFVWLLVGIALALPAALYLRSKISLP